MSIRLGLLTVGFVLAASAAGAAPATPTAEQRQAFKHLLRVIGSRPFLALDWHELRLTAGDERMAAQLRDALARSGRSAAGIAEQGLWIDAAAGHPEAALAHYDANVRDRPTDRTLPNAACWARAAHGFDPDHAVAVCDAAVAADRQAHTLTFRGMAELRTGLNAAALRDFDEALADPRFRTHPMLAWAVFGRGLVRTRLGDAGGEKDRSVASRADRRVAAVFADAGIDQ